MFSVVSEQSEAVQIAPVANCSTTQSLDCYTLEKSTLQQERHLDCSLSFSEQNEIFFSHHEPLSIGFEPKITPIRGSPSL